ncbi:Protein of unknown function (DUF2993) [Labedella gwakjiensis]|uniref:DUF2993 domain-containing protein n=1 Tax=Labedella gwakjiensis TaxID=390269 RepID=A0A2P8GY98_9MICO|nr:DUF2993 domain-containing protein [Labedella gwakjiensis]PSL38934.1 Protein of unknown function (DUF2993) [Labedella gwakjiensis]RUQ86604.1 DUF2993 domain-containing protein [Labedella gwakjiensis]
MTDDFFVARPVEKNPSRGRRWVIGLVVAIVLLVLGIVALIAGDGIARNIAEDVVKTQVEQKLPETVEADVDVSIEGDWVIVQLLSGTLERVVLSDDAAVIDGVPMGLEVTASRVPTDIEQPVGRVDAVATLDEDALNSFVEMPGNDPTLQFGDGTLAYEDGTALFGLRISYLLRVIPEAAGTSLVFTPDSAEVTTDLGTIDLQSVLDLIVGDAPVTVCVANYLPEGAQLTGLEVAPDAAELSLGISDVVLDGALLDSRGTCG